MLKFYSRAGFKLQSNNLFKQNRYPFTIYSNQHQRDAELVGEKTVKYDSFLNEYDKAVKAFLAKRWTKKEELPPKIYIIDPVDEVKDSLNQQRLVFMKKLLEHERLQKMSDANDMNSQYLMSITLEEHLKPLFDEYLKKVLVNGQVVPMKKLEEYNQIVNDCKKVYMRFFFGDELTELEKDIESRYLLTKQGKYMKYLASERPQFKCIWTYTQQRRLEQMKNYISRDLKYYDDFRPVYEEMNLESKLDNVYETMKINDDSLKRKVIFHLFEKGYYEKSKKRAIFVTKNLITRALLYTQSIEFTKVLNIPPDFHIEHSISNLHIWLMLDRLKKLDTVESKFMAKQIDYEFKKVTLEKANQIHLRKKNDFINDVNHFMLNNRIAYDKHFNKNPKTSLRPYYKLDALVWSTIFFEKVPRYSEIVYMMSEYIMQHYEYLANESFENFMYSNIQWDVYRIPVNYKDTLQAINPPLTDEELDAEIKSDNKIKKHFYSYDDPEYELPINTEVNNVVKRRFENIHYKIFETLRKYNSMETYDFYSEREEKEQEESKSKEKYAIWKTKNSVNKLTPAEDIKRKLREKRSSGN